VTDPIKDQREIDGPLPDLLRGLDEIFQVHISVASDVITQPVEMRHPDYPIAALQQLARNAVLHRTYENTYAPVRIYWFSDRIEILSPGGPFGQVNRDNFGKPNITDYRNPHLAEAMKNLGYVQKFGLGIQLARKELEKNGNPPPEFDAQDAHVLATVRRRP
jgi:ATP-dependent DNA helicase RecG